MKQYSDFLEKPSQFDPSVGKTPVCGWIFELADNITVRGAPREYVFLFY